MTNTSTREYYGIEIYFSFDNYLLLINFDRIKSVVHIELLTVDSARYLIKSSRVRCLQFWHQTTFRSDLS